MRIYQSMPFEIGKKFELNQFASHHLIQVMRMKVGETITLFNGQGGEYRARIYEIAKKKALVFIEDFFDREVEPLINIYLAQGISRGEKMDWTIQKAVELGVTKIIPLFSGRSTVKLDTARAQQRLLHWQTIAIGAAEQCGRNRLPEILPPSPFYEGVASLSADWRFILQPGGQALHQVVGPFLPRQSIVLLIGPEGGLCDEEIKFAEQHQFKALALGPRILRTETAAIAAIAIFQSYFGDMQ